MRRPFITALTLALSAGLMAAGSGAAATGDLKLLKDGQLSVASDVPYAPFEYFARPGSRRVIGFDVDLVKAAAATFGIKTVNFVDQTFDSIFISIPQGRFDMAASSISITAKRKRQALFSDSYFLANQSIMVKKGSSIRRLKDLEGKTIGAQRGTTGADLAAKVKGATVKRYEEIDDAFGALVNGRVEAVVNDFAISAFATRSRKNLEVVAQIDTKEGYGLMFAKDRTALRDAFNEGLTTIRASGTYARIYKKWFNQEPPK